MNKRTTIVGGCASLAALVTAILAAALPTFAAVQAQSSAGCTTADLVVWLDTQGDAGAGSVYHSLKFTNLSGHACTLTGYPGISAVSLSGKQLGAAAARQTSPAHVVRLAAGATASAMLRIVQAANFPSSSCGVVSAAGLRVFPPGQTAARIVPIPFSACSRTASVFLTTRAVA